MKRYDFNSGTIGLRYLLVVFVLSLSSNFLLAQNKEGLVENIVIAYDTPFSYALNEEVSWDLQGTDGVVTSSGMGNINKAFSKPGIYTIHINENHAHSSNSCDHSHGPEKLSITVTSEKVKFDFSSIHFSQEIRGGYAANGIVLSINAIYTSYDNTPGVYNQDITSFGVGSTISGKLKNGAVTMNPGNNIIEFVLDGQSSRGDNVQLNFTDFSGDVQPYSLTPKLQ